MSRTPSLAAIPHRYRRPELITVTLVIVLVVGAELLVAVGNVSPLLLRRPSQVAVELAAAVQTRSLQIDVLATAYRVAATFVISLVLTTVLSITFWRNETLRNTFIPMLSAVIGTPFVLGYLVLIPIFGRGDLTIILISLDSAIIMIINATDALASVDDVLVDVSRSFDAGKFQTMWKVIIPAAAPDIFAGIRLGFSYIMISVTAIEFLLTINRGLGGRISNLYLRFRTGEMFVGIVFIVLLVVISIFTLRRMEVAIRR